MNIIKDEFWKNNKRRIFLVLCGVVLVSPFLFIPVKCHFIVEPTPPMDGIGGPQGSVTTMGSHGIAECFSLLHKEFWVEKTWELRFVSIFSLENNYSFYPWTPVTIHPLYAADYSNNQILMGASHNVFVGKIISQIGNGELMESPTTLFTVEVLSNIKGNMEGIVTVEQEGGYKDGVEYIVEDGAPFLDIGSTYLLATRYRAKDNSYTLNAHPNASKLLSDDPTLTGTKLKALIDKDEKVKTLEAAYPNEELLEADVYHANTRNNFHSLPPDAKAEANARASEARVWLERNTKAQQ